MDLPKGGHDLIHCELEVGGGGNLNFGGARQEGQRECRNENGKTKFHHVAPKKRGEILFRRRYSISVLSNVMTWIKGMRPDDVSQAAS